MDEYINNFTNYKKILVYDFQLGWGGIGDCIKFFMYILNFSIINHYKLYYLVNSIPLETYIKLKFPIMYINKHELKNVHPIQYLNQLLHLEEDKHYIVNPFLFYKTYSDTYINIPIQNVFLFDDLIIKNSFHLLAKEMNNYICIHLRLGDKYLETDKKYVLCKEDEREFDENRLFKFIESLNGKNVLFFCDNNNYKLKIKNIFPFIIITNSNIGHTSLANTSDRQIIDSVTEFYIMTNSKKIYYASNSGFSVIASKFKNIPLISI